MINKLNIKDYWNQLTKFEKAEDVPDLPRVEKEEWNNFYIPKLIECGAITKKDLENNTWYYGEYRNTNYGKWNEKTQKFDHWRYKFGWWRTDNCNHFEDDNGFALFVPLRKATIKEIKEQEEKGDIDTFVNLI